MIGVDPTGGTIWVASVDEIGVAVASPEFTMPPKSIPVSAETIPTKHKKNNPTIATSAFDREIFLLLDIKAPYPFFSINSFNFNIN